jgi:hypothetical protein
MITILHAVFITLLFSFWVWTLKQDIETLKHIGGTADGHEGECVARAPGALPHHQVDKHDPFDTAIKNRGRGGVPTWTIG